MTVNLHKLKYIYQLLLSAPTIIYRLISCFILIRWLRIKIGHMYSNLELEKFSRNTNNLFKQSRREFERRIAMRLLYTYELILLHEYLRNFPVRKVSICRVMLQAYIVTNYSKWQTRKVFDNNYSKMRILFAAWFQRYAGNSSWGWRYIFLRSWQAFALKHMSERCIFTVCMDSCAVCARTKSHQ